MSPPRLQSQIANGTPFNNNNSNIINSNGNFNLISNPNGTQNSAMLYALQQQQNEMMSQTNINQFQMQQQQQTFAPTQQHNLNNHDTTSSQQNLLEECKNIFQGFVEVDILCSNIDLNDFKLIPGVSFDMESEETRRMVQNYLAEFSF